jgi:hypothetical protein
MLLSSIIVLDPRKKNLTAPAVFFAMVVFGKFKNTDMAPAPKHSFI